MNVYAQWKNGSKIYSIAEGSGGTLATMGTLFPGFKLAYNTLLYPNIDNRDNITFKDPPSFMNNPSLFARLIDDQYRLTQGNTDITSTEWILEFDKVLGNYSPAIVTMDAESMEHGNNLNFVEALFPILAKHKPSIILFKVFLEHESVLERMTCIAEELFGNIHYFSTIIKPISSNPCGTESFLVVVLKRLISETSMCGLNKIRNHLNYIIPIFSNDGICTTNGFTVQNLEKYVEISEQMSQFYKLNFPNVILENKFDLMIKNDNCCQLMCINHIQLLMDQIDLIHSQKNEKHAWVVVRRSGTNKKLTTLLYELIMCIFCFSWQKSIHAFCSIILKLDSLLIIKEISIIREEFNNSLKGKQDELVPMLKINVSLKDQSDDYTSFMQEYSDKKFAIREMMKFSKKCNCIPLIRSMSYPQFKHSFSTWIIRFMILPLLSNKLVGELNYNIKVLKTEWHTKSEGHYSLIGDKIIPLKYVDEQFEEIDKEPSVWMGLYYN